MAIHESSTNWKPFVRSAALEVDAKFPRRDWTSTYPGHGENSSVGAYAVDFMCDKATGDKIYAYLVANRKRLGIRYVIWYRRWINWGTDGDGAKSKPYFDGYAVNANGTPNPSRQHTNHVHASFEVNGKHIPLVPFPDYYVDPAKVDTTLTGNNLSGGPDRELKPGEVIADGLRIEGVWLITASGYSYHTGYLTKMKPAPVVKPAPIPAPSKPAAETPKPEEPTVPKDDGPTFTKVAYLNLPGTGNWQGAIPTKDHWYAVEARKQSDGSEDTFVYRLSLDGDLSNLKPGEEPMRLDAGPGFKVHPTGWGVSDTGVLWFTWNEDGNSIITVQYRSGARVTKDDCQEMTVATKGNAQIAFDVDNEMASVRVITAATDTHILRTKQDILDGVDRKLGTIRIPRRKDRIVQGFTVAKAGPTWELRVLVGLESANSPFGIERWRFDTAKHVGTIAIPKALGREPEGIDGNLFSMKTDDRQGLDVYRYTLG